MMIKSIYIVDPVPLSCYAWRIQVLFINENFAVTYRSQVYKSLDDVIVTLTHACLVVVVKAKKKGDRRSRLAAARTYISWLCLRKNFGKLLGPSSSFASKGSID